MANHIPFISSISDSRLVGKFYPDSAMTRMDLSHRMNNEPPGIVRVWLDPAIDGLHRLDDRKPSWINYVSQFPHFNKIGDPSFQASPKKEVVKVFVFAVLDTCIKYNPDWITVPQLPPSKIGAYRNSINRSLADATGEWRSLRSFPGNLILPLTFTNQKQLRFKAERTQRIKAALSCFDRASANGIWAVDSSLNDGTGSQTFQKRFPELINFHTELNAALPSGATTIAGPYWGLSLVLWARGLIDYPAIGVGTGYQYFLSGGIMKPTVSKVALSPLRRRATVTPDLGEWLSQSLKRLSPEDESQHEFQKLLRSLPQLQDKNTAKRQTANFYKHWFDRIAAHPPPGRALALYQDFSSAYVLGRTLGELSKTEGTARHPERPAEQFMLICL